MEPLVFKLNKTDSIIKNDINASSSNTTIQYPLSSLGFHHYIHQTRSKMEKTKQFEGKKQIFYVVNPFEKNIDDYQDDIQHVAAKYFDTKILSRAFYNLWEILYTFDLIDLNEKNFTSAHLAEAPGSFIQATMFFRDLFSKNSKNDKYHVVTLDTDDPGAKIPAEFISANKRVMLHRTYPRDIARIDKTKNDGDLTNPKTIEMFGGEVKKAQFITADGGFRWDNETIQEQEVFKLLVGQIITAIKIQDIKGNFVCKFYETFTINSAKLLAILTELYENVYIIKPYTSRPSNSEKYVICINFNNKNLDIIVDKLLAILNEKGKFITNMFPSYELASSFRTAITNINISIANQQYIIINKMVEFIDSQNYRGEQYQNYRYDQIRANKFWIETFLPPKDKFISERTKYQKSIKI